MEKFTPYAKALIAFLTATLGSLVSTSSNGWSQVEVLSSILAGIVSLGAVYRVPNADTPEPK